MALLGWVYAALTTLIYKLFVQRQVQIAERSFQKFFWSINLGIVLTFFLSNLFTEPVIMLYDLGGVGGTLQLVAVVLVLQFLVPLRTKSKSIFSTCQWNILKPVAALLFVKMGLQLLTAFAYFADLAATYLDFTIAYLHGTFLGVVTISLLLFLEYFGFLKIPKNAYRLYIVGFMATEIRIFYKGWAAWQGLAIFEGHFEVLATVSFLIPVGLVMILFGKPKAPVLKDVKTGTSNS